jgi:glycosyltransferase involved in cell wall biosynthesis
LVITGCVYAKNSGRNSFTGLDYVVSDIVEKIGSESDITVFTTTPYPSNSEMNNAVIKSYSYTQLLPYIMKNIPKIKTVIKNKNLGFREKIKLTRALLLSELVSDLCKNEHFDLISMQGAGHCNYMLANAAYRNRIPTVYSLHGLLSFGAPKIDYIDRMAEIELLKYIKRKSHTITVVSEGIKTLICEKYDINPECVCVFNNAVKFPQIDGNSLNGNSKGRTDKINIISVGTLCERKNQIQLLRAFKLLPEHIKKKCKITLVGRDDTKGKLKDYIVKNKLENSVDLCGFLPKNEIAKLYLHSTFNVMLSISEGFGLSMIEAAYFGIPTLTFDDLEAAHDIYTEDSMILMKDRSDETVCNGLLCMIERKWDSIKIRNSVQRFNEDIYLGYLRKFEQICEESVNIIDEDFTEVLLKEV